MKFLMSILFLFASVTVHGASHLEAWCGHTDSIQKHQFPYTAAIYSYKSKHGPVKIATVYKRGRIVTRQLVHRSESSGHVDYMAPNDFSLSISSLSKKPSSGDFRAVIHDEDGDKLIGTASIKCVVRNKSGKS